MLFRKITFQDVAKAGLKFGDEGERAVTYFYEDDISIRMFQSSIPKKRRNNKKL